MYKYIIIDDDYLARKGIIKKLEPIQQNIECIGEAENGEEAIPLIETKKPSIIIMDMYMPVMDGTELLKYISRFHPNIYVIVISGYRDFEYAQETIRAKAINYLVKPFSRQDIQNSMLQAINNIEERAKKDSNLRSVTQEYERISYEFDVQTLKSLILGINLNDIEFKFTSAMMKNLVANCNYCLFTLVNVDLKIQSLQKFCNENFKNIDQIIFDYNIDSSIMFIIIFMDKKIEMNKISQDYANKLYSLLKSDDIEASIGVSQPGGDITKLEQSFNECITALDNKYLLSKGGVFIFSMKSMSCNNIIWDGEAAFKFYLEIGNWDIVSRMLKELFLNISNSSIKYTFMDYKYYIFNLINITKIDSSTDMITAISTDITGNLRRRFSFLFDMELLFSLTTNMIFSICQWNLENPIYTSNNVIENMQLYIKRNYYNDISLEFISNLFFLNPSYVSTLFKTRTGMRFIDYVTKIRLEKAVELLQNTNMRLSQVSSSIGYKNSKYFFRVFKKLTGYTPEDFRLKTAKVNQKDKLQSFSSESTENNPPFGSYLPIISEKGKKN